MDDLNVSNEKQASGPEDCTLDGLLGVYVTLQGKFVA